MRKFWRGLGWTVGALAVIALFLRLFFITVWTMPDDPYLVSNAPTLAPGDVVLVLHRGEPGFGDLVRCPDPQQPGQWVVGRIAGVSGDQVEMDGARLVVNGKTYSGESACTEPRMMVRHPETQKETEVACEVVQMGGGWHYRAAAITQFQEQKKSASVGFGKVFLASDNRTMHDDSRDFGLLDRDTCKERVVFRLWSKAGWSDDKSRMTIIH
ncbi:MAG: signal peptidase I [Polyangiaceae bacterium]|nr:signal peptidase I [Polyangiaceae bacterium]